MAKCPFNGLSDCPDDCMALDMTKFGHRSCKVADACEGLSGLPDAVYDIGKTLLDTLGSAKSGDALDAVARVDDAMGIIANEIGEVADALREVRNG